VIYNILGQVVRTLVAGSLDQGTHLVRWDGKDDGGNALSSGVYLYRMQAGTFSAGRKMVLIR
jgi:flagellar hook assembly protein FlgD